MSEANERERLDRVKVYHGKRVFDALVALNRAVYDAKKAEIDIGVIGELDVYHLIKVIEPLNGQKATIDARVVLRNLDAKAAKKENEAVPDLSGLESDVYEGI